MELPAKYQSQVCGRERGGGLKKKPREYLTNNFKVQALPDGVYSPMEIAGQCRGF